MPIIYPNPIRVNRQPGPDLTHKYPIMTELDRQLEEATRLLALQASEFQLYGKTSQETADAIAAGSTKGATRLTAAGQSAAAGLGQLASGATAFTRSLYQGEQGMKGMNGVMDGLGGAADEFGTALLTLGGPFGIAAGILLKLVSAATKAAKVVGEHADKQFETYQKLARIGATAADGMRGTTDVAYKLGYNISNLDQFVSLIEKNSQSLALFGGTAAQGRDALAQLGESLKDQRQSFLNLGIGLDNMNEGLAGFVNLQVQTGQKNSTDIQDMANAARDYVYEQDILTRLTGQTREATESARKKALEEERFLAVVRKADREKAGSGQKLRALNDMVEASFAPEIAKGVRDLMTGVVNSDESRKVLLSGNTELVSLLAQFKDGNISQVDLVDRMDENLRSFAKTHGQAISIMGEGGKTQVSASAQSQSLAREQVKLADSEASVRRDQALAKTGEVDKTIKNQAELEKKSRDNKEKMDKAIDNFIEPLGRAMGNMLNIVDDLVDGIRGLVGWFTGKEPDQRRATQESVAAAQIKFNEAQTKFEQEKERIGQDTNEANREANTKLLETLKQQVETSHAGLENEKQLMAQGTSAERRERRRAQRESGAGADTGAPGSGGAPTVSAAGVKDPTAKILEHIGQKESGGNYNKLVGGAVEPKLTKMTISEVQDYQRRMGSGELGRFESTAVGKYQIIKSTLAELVAQGKASPNDAYDPATQEKLGRALLEKRGLNRYLSGQIPKDQFMDSLSMEWASLPFNTGKSYYAGTGSNRSLMSRDEFSELFMADGGIATRPSIAGEAGPEAVIPLVNGRVPVDLGLYADQLQQIDTQESPDTVDPVDLDTDSIDLDQVVQEVAGEIMSANDIELEMLDLLALISRAGRSTADNNRKFHRAHY